VSSLVKLSRLALSSKVKYILFRRRFLYPRFKVNGD